MQDSLLVTRLRIAVAPDNYRQVSETTGINAETVRRYMTGKTPPSAKFLAEVCKAYRVQGSWLLLGDGPRTKAELMDMMLTKAKAAQVLESLADRLENLEGRLEGLEKQSLAARGQLSSVASEPE